MCLMCCDEVVGPATNKEGMKADDQKPEDVDNPIMNSQETPQGLNNITSNVPQKKMKIVGLNQVTKIGSLYRKGNCPHGFRGNKGKWQEMRV